jgi:Zn-dependent peptidase ImmA (M78 family)
MEQTEDIIGDATKARAKMARAEALKLWKKHGEGKIPVMPEKIIEALGIPCREAELNKMEGVAHADGNGVTFIMYNRNLAPNRKRSTLAHELGHIILEHVGMDASSQFSTNSQETEAKEFANALLVPADDLKAFMKQGYKRIDQIMERYQVSKDTALIAVNRNRLFPRLLSTAVALNLV